MALINIKPYTQFNNEFIDTYMRKISGSAMKVFSAISRKTIGFHKDTDAIALSQIMELTGLSKKSVISAIRELESFDIITAERSFGCTNNYTLKFDSSGEKIGTSDKNETGVKSTPVQKGNRCGVKSTPVDTETGVKSTHTKESLKETLKDNIAPEKPSAPCKDIGRPHQYIKDIFIHVSKVYGKQEYYHDAREAKAIKLLEPRIVADEKLFLLHVKKFIDLRKSADKFWNEQPLIPSVFLNLYNRIGQIDTGAKLGDTF